MKRREMLNLIWNLAKNDFATKYSGNYLGIFWAFVQPVITVAIYIFIFQMAFRAGNVMNGYPYTLWLIAGIVPWFFFCEALLGATNAFMEYSYLVKKVVFHIEVLPFVRVVSALFVHLFFVAISLLVFVFSGRIPDWRIIQVVYYMFSMVCLVTVLSYFTASIVPVFRDFYQIVNIILQIGMWITPIMWNFNDMAEGLGKWGIIFKLNPMFYIVQGYRDSFMRGELFWVRIKMTVYFWGLIIILGLVSYRCFKRMKPHFADVL